MVLHYLIFPLFSMWSVFNGTITQAEKKNHEPDLHYVASTPGDDALIKKYLAIPTTVKSDFIRWDLSLQPEETSFVLQLQYGESKPNTLGFMFDGMHQTIKGIYQQIKGNDSNPDRYNFISTDQAIRFSALLLNTNLLHILNDEHRLMVGNGGWSYTLNRKNPMTAKPESFAALLDKKTPVVYPAVEVFDGRTPCMPLATDHDLPAQPNCFKLKWRLTLHRDPVTNKPTTYKLRNVINNQSEDLEGKWRIFNGTSTVPDAIVYQLDQDTPQKTMRLLVGDEQVLFFLDKQDRPYTGNKDFSFTLNKRK